MHAVDDEGAHVGCQSGLQPRDTPPHLGSFYILPHLSTYLAILQNLTLGGEVRWRRFALDGGVSQKSRRVEMGGIPKKAGYNIRSPRNKRQKK